jgi:hypothetical protein
MTKFIWYSLFCHHSFQRLHLRAISTGLLLIQYCAYSSSFWRRDGLDIYVFLAKIQFISPHILGKV